MAHVAEIDNIIQPEAKIWNRLVVFFQKVSCQVICEEHSPNRFTALVKNVSKIDYVILGCSLIWHQCSHYSMYLSQFHSDTAAD